MKKYKEIHIWEFPATLTFIKLNNKFRIELFNKVISKAGSQKKLLDILNRDSIKYKIKRHHSRLNLYGWIKGQKFYRSKIKKINIPLWVLIEFSKILSENKKKCYKMIKEIEENIDYYTGTGKSYPIINPKLPLYLTPEMVSVIFHFVGDGHIGRKKVCSSYRQMNKEGLNNFLLKLKNIFGNFQYNKKEFENGRLNIPKIITEFYKYYFNLYNTSTFKAYIPRNIKLFNKEFLVAGLTSFIVDEGYVGKVITIYSKNKILLNDIREIAIKCGYICYQIRKKNRYGKFDVYRFNISSKSYNKLYEDLEDLEELFSSCNLVHKNVKLIKNMR